jgi:uncharacterized protein (TIGR02284 family)
MTTSDDRALALLHALLRICRDSAEGYVTAERDLPDREVARELDRYRQQRLKVAEELQQRIRDLRGDPDAGPTLPGALHRAWMDARSGGAANPVEALLTEIERGEDMAVDAFRQALAETDIDAATRRMLERHYELVQAAHDRVKQLRDRANYARLP